MIAKSSARNKIINHILSTLKDDLNALGKAWDKGK